MKVTSVTPIACKTPIHFPLAYPFVEHNLSLAYMLEHIPSLSAYRMFVAGSNYFVVDNHNWIVVG
jgi:hypothetical protein